MKQSTITPSNSVKEKTCNRSIILSPMPNKNLSKNTMIKIKPLIKPALINKNKQIQTK